MIALIIENAFWGIVFSIWIPVLYFLIERVFVVHKRKINIAIKGYKFSILFRILFFMLFSAAYEAIKQIAWKTNTWESFFVYENLMIDWMPLIVIMLIGVFILTFKSFNFNETLINSILRMSIYLLFSFIMATFCFFIMEMLLSV